MDRRLLQRAYSTAAKAVVGSASSEDRNSSRLAWVPAPAAVKKTGRNVMKPQFTTPQLSPYTMIPRLRGRYGAARSDTGASR
jgi:hypothetical protein